MAKVLEGKAVAAAMAGQLRLRAEALARRGVAPRLAILRVGENGSDLAYERAAAKRCAALGIGVETVTLPGDADTQAVLAAIDRVNADDRIHRPLPQAIDDGSVRQRLSARKDVDGIGPASLARLFTGSGEGFSPCTAQACLELLDYYGVSLRGRHAVIIGRSLVVSRPLALLLVERDATVTICHTKTVDLPALCRTADILVSAAGKAGLVDASYLRPGQVVVDVGVNVSPEGKLCGDVRFEQAEKIVDAISPVPGGVGSVTTLVLCKHVIQAAEAVCGLPDGTER